MIKLLKYDWKRNATAITATLCILIVVQIALTALTWFRDWKSEPMYVISSMLYMLCGFLAFMAACMTFNANIRAYSRRLLPIPSLYSVLSPLVLLIGSHIVIGLLFILHEGIYYLLFEMESLMSLVIEHLNPVQMLSVLLSYAWGLIFTSIVVFFGISFSRMFEGRIGTFMGIVICIAIIIAVTWLGNVIFPGYGESSWSFGFFRMELANEAAANSEAGSIIPFEMMQLGEVLYDLVCASALLYGIVYIMDRKMKF